MGAKIQIKYDSVHNFCGFFFLHRPFPQVRSLQVTRLSCSVGAEGPRRGSFDDQFAGMGALGRSEGDIVGAGGILPEV